MFRACDRIGLGSLALAGSGPEGQDLPMTGEQEAPVPAALPFWPRPVKHLEPARLNDVHREFAYASHAVHPRPSPPEAGSYALASRFERPLAGWDTWSERFPRFVTSPQLLVGYG